MARDLADVLVPRMGGLPTSNASYFRSAVLTRMAQPDPGEQQPADWQVFGRTTAHAGEITALAFSADGTTLASADTEGVVLRWQRSTLSREVPPLRGHTGAVADLAFLPDGRLATADVIGTVRVVEPHSLVTRHPARDEVTSLAAGVTATPDGRLIVGPLDGSLVLIDPADPASAEPIMDLAADEAAMLRAWVGDDRTRIAIAGSDGTMTFWSHDRTGRLPITSPTRHEGTITSMTFSPDGTRVVTGDDRGHRIHWNVDTGEATNLAEAGDRTVGGLAFLRRGDRQRGGLDADLVSTGWDDQVRLWAGGPTPTVLPALTDRGTAVATSPDGTTIAVGAADGSITLYTDMADRITGPLTLPRPDHTDATARPAEGVLLTHEQSWRMAGITLGELVHSVSLAPGEVTQLAVSNHTTRVLQHSSDALSQVESAARQADRQTTDEQSETASAFEMGSGGTTATSSGSNASLGGGGLFFSAGGSTSSSVATTVSHASGVRAVADEANQDVHQRTSQFASSNRARHAAAVREVGEADALELRTRVVANYNHMHALNLQYYEVIQVSQLATRVVDAQRLIFVPVKVLAFAVDQVVDDAIEAFPGELATALRALGHPGAATCLEHLMIGRDEDSDLRDHRLAKVFTEADANLTRRDDARTALDTASKAARAAHTAALRAQDALRDAEDPGLEERDRLQRALAAARQADADAQADATAAAATWSRASRAHAELLTRQHAVERALASAGITLGEEKTLSAAQVSALRAHVGRLLRANQMRINQHLWMQLPPSTWTALLEGTAFEGQPLAHTVEPIPVGVSGSLVAFPWHHEDADEAAAFREHHLQAAEEVKESVALPTGGIFGEAVLGESNAADTIDITRYWNWKDSLPPILPAAIDPLGQPAPETATGPTLDRTPASTIDMGQVRFADVAPGADGVLAALSKPDLFRDLTGTETSAALAQSAMELSKEGASEAADLAGENYRRFLKTQQALMSAAAQAAGQPSGEDFDPTLAGAVLNARPGGPSGDDATGGSGSSPGAGGRDDDGTGDLAPGTQVSFTKAPADEPTAPTDEAVDDSQDDTGDDTRDETGDDEDGPTP